MNIIIEGLDNCGKSTLIRNLKNKMNNLTFHNIHYSSVKQISVDDHIAYSKKLYEEMFSIMFNCKSINFILDRSHIGEMVYSPLYRGYSGDYVLDIEELYFNVPKLRDGLYLIVLVDNPENLISREDGLSHSIDIDMKKKEVDLFCSAFEKSNIRKKILINISDQNEEKLLETVLKFLG